MEIVINKCFGGFGLSNKAFEELIKLGWTVSKDGDWEDKTSDIIYDSKEHFGNYYCRRQDIRTNLDVIKVVKELKDEASGDCARLRIIEIPDDIEWEIDDYDGQESVHEVHRSWG